MTTANVADLVAVAARNWPDTAAVVDTASGLRLTWAQVDDAVNADAARLRAAGLRPGDRVAVRLPTSPTFVVAVFAVMRAGGVAVPYSPQSPPAEFAGLVGHSGADIVVSGDFHGEGVTMLGPPAVENVGSGDGGAPVGGGEDIAMLFYTTASKGAPRGVMLSHRALLANVSQVAAMSPPPIRTGDRVLVAIPAFHVYGLGPGLLQAANVGATAVLSERFDARQALAECVRHDVTVILGVPAMYAEFATLPADELSAGLASVRLLTSGAAPLHPKVLAAIDEASGLGVFEGYGLTETAPVVTSSIVSGRPKPGSVGRPIPGVEVKLVPEGASEGGEVFVDDDDPDDVFDEDGATGLVCVRGDNVFSGYWPDGDGGPDADGWFRTSDVGYLDVDGDLHLVDRANDLIIVNGFNVYPHEVEDVIGELADVDEVAVVGVVDERSGESVKAVVVPRRAAALSEQQVMEHCAAKLARYKVPRTIVFTDALPHTVTGKIHRSAL